MIASTRGLDENGLMVALRAPEMPATTTISMHKRDDDDRPSRRSEPATTIVTSSSPAPLSRKREFALNCASWLGQGYRWIVRRRWELIPAALNGTMGFCGLMEGSWLATGGISLSATAAVGITYLGLKHKHDSTVEIGGGAALVLADMAVCSGTGLSWFSLAAFTLTTGAAYLHYGNRLAEQRNTRMKLHIDTVKAKGALPGAMGMDAADPGLVGSSPEETALRKALHALTGATPLDVPAFSRLAGGGFEALVSMPPGRATSPAAITARRDQLAANLGLPGRLFLEQGPSAHLLSVRLVVVDALEGTIPWTGPSITSILQPVLLAHAEDGSEIRQTLHRNHVFVAGASDNGKSGIVNLIICNLLNCDDVDTYGIDLKAGAPELGIYRDVFKMLATTPEQARFLLEWIEGEYQRRGRLLGGLSDDGIPVRQWVPGEHGNDIAVITDEMAELIEHDPELAVLYRRLAALVRYVGIIMVSATQTPSAKVFGGDKDGAANYQVQIGLRVISPTQTNIVMGAGMHGQGWRLSELDAPGKVMIRSRENPTPKRAKAIYTNDHDIAAEIRRRCDRYGITPTTPDGGGPGRGIHLVQAEATVYRYPDGSVVGREEWPKLWRVFEEMGSATKAELQNAGVVSSRDTVRRALEVWAQHGVLHRRDGMSTRYYLPDRERQSA
ncbi:FtsK/SpoIIIE domain-containing protein [Streptacidiphilus sp. EB129]|uniref:FtsK/SpoIIIE domain-containing protein n=1 Tax=Streptacidiphilus sp. EB129 TaxID=3156262 RepID=UPI0035170670